MVALIPLAAPMGGAEAATTAGGMQLWVSRYQGPWPGVDTGEDVAVSSDGARVFVTGYSAGASGDPDWATLAYDGATGATLWAARFNGQADDIDAATALAISPDDSLVFVTGHTETQDTGQDYLTMAYDAASGGVRWVKRYNGTGSLYQVPSTIAVSPDGTKLFVTGYSIGSNDSNYATLAYDSTTGTPLWARHYDGPGHGPDQPYGLGVSPDGSTVFVTGLSDFGPGERGDFVTLGYDVATGRRDWISRYDGPASGDDFAYSLAVMPDGSSVFVTGTSQDASGLTDYGTVAINAKRGAPFWVRRFDGSAGLTDYPTTVGISPDGLLVFVTGFSTVVDGTYDVVTLAYDATTGSTVWARRFNGPANGSDLPEDLAVSLDGSAVYVAGVTDVAGGDHDYLTLCYDAVTGEPLGVRRYDGPGDSADRALAVAVSDQDVYVTGYSTGGDADLDYATVAYAI